MRVLILLPLLALGACSGENRGWNPNYRAEATPYGNYLRARETALTGRRAEPPRVIPVALPAKAPTAAEIAGPSPVRIVERETTLAAAQVGITANRQPARKATAPAIDTGPVVVYPVRRAPAAIATAPAALAPVAPASVAPDPAPIVTPPAATGPTVTTAVLPPAGEPSPLTQYALASRHQPGARQWTRDGSVRGDCAAFASADAAQQAFLTAGGPQRDALGLDLDGDGYVCGWTPAAHRPDAL